MPTISQIAAECNRLANEQAVKDRSQLTRKIADWLKRLQKAIASQSPEMPYGTGQSSNDRSKANALGISLAEYNAVLDAFTVCQPEFERLANVAREQQLRVKAEAAEQERIQSAAVFDRAGRL